MLYCPSATVSSEDGEGDEGDEEGWGAVLYVYPVTCGSEDGEGDESDEEGGGAVLHVYPVTCGGEDGEGDEGDEQGGGAGQKGHHGPVVTVPPQVAQLLHSPMGQLSFKICCNFFFLNFCQSWINNLQQPWPPRQKLAPFQRMFSQYLFLEGELIL